MRVKIQLLFFFLLCMAMMTASRNAYALDVVHLSANSKDPILRITNFQSFYPEVKGQVILLSDLLSNSPGIVHDKTLSRVLWNGGENPQGGWVVTALKSEFPAAITRELAIEGRPFSLSRLFFWQKQEAQKRLFLLTRDEGLLSMESSTRPFGFFVFPLNFKQNQQTLLLFHADTPNAQVMVFTPEAWKNIVKNINVSDGVILGILFVSCLYFLVSFLLEEDIRFAISFLISLLSVVFLFSTRHYFSSVFAEGTIFFDAMQLAALSGIAAIFGFTSDQRPPKKATFLYATFFAKRIIACTLLCSIPLLFVPSLLPIFYFPTVSLVVISFAFITVGPWMAWWNRKSLPSPLHLASSLLFCVTAALLFCTALGWFNVFSGTYLAMATALAGMTFFGFSLSHIHTARGKRAGHTHAPLQVLPLLEGSILWDIPHLKMRVQEGIAQRLSLSSYLIKQDEFERHIHKDDRGIYEYAVQNFLRKALQQESPSTAFASKETSAPASNAKTPPFRFSIRLQDGQGKPFFVMIQLLESWRLEGKLQHVLLHLTEMEDLHQQYKQFLEDSMSNSLIHLPNVQAAIWHIEERLKQRLHALSKDAFHESPAVLAIEFVVNESNHPFPKQAFAFLSQIATQLEKVIRALPDFSLFHLGGLQFLVLFAKSVTHQKQMLEIQEKLHAVLHKRIKLPLQGAMETPQCFFGLSMVGGREATLQATTLIEEAKTACALARAQQNDGFLKVYDPQNTRLEPALRWTLDYELGQAIKNKNIHLLYHPIISVKTNRNSGVLVEAVWAHPIRGELPWSQFTPPLLDMSSGVFLQLQKFLFQQAAHELPAMLKNMQDPAFQIHLPIITPDIFDPSHQTWIDQTLKDASSHQGRICFSIQESVFTRSHLACLHFMQRQRAFADFTLAYFGSSLVPFAALLQAGFSWIGLDQDFLRPKLMQDSKTLGAEQAEKELMKMLRAFSSMRLTPLVQHLSSKPLHDLLKKAPLFPKKSPIFSYGARFSSPLKLDELQEFLQSNLPIHEDTKEAAEEENEPLEA